jgi:hypothetical protein
MFRDVWEDPSNEQECSESKLWVEYAIPTLKGKKAVEDGWENWGVVTRDVWISMTVPMSPGGDNQFRCSSRQDTTRGGFLSPSWEMSPIPTADMTRGFMGPGQCSVDEIRDGPTPNQMEIHLLGGSLIESMQQQILYAVGGTGVWGEDHPSSSEGGDPRLRPVFSDNLSTPHGTTGSEAFQTAQGLVESGEVSSLDIWIDGNTDTLY